MDFSAIIAEELNLEVWRVSKALELMDQGGTIPFIARYRKDQTGTLNEIELRDISHRRDYLQRRNSRLRLKLARTRLFSKIFTLRSSRRSVLAQRLQRNLVWNRSPA